MLKAELEALVEEQKKQIAALQSELAVAVPPTVELDLKSAKLVEVQPLGKEPLKGRVFVVLESGGEQATLEGKL